MIEGDRTKEGWKRVARQQKGNVKLVGKDANESQGKKHPCSKSLCTADNAET